MPDLNPYDAPEPTSMATAALLSPPRIVSSVFFVIGTLCLLLLNGQHFTNSMVFLAFVTASGFLWLRFLLRNRSRDPDAGRFAVLVHVVVFFAVAATLPNAYERQKKFNNAINRVKTLNQAPQP